MVLAVLVGLDIELEMNPRLEGPIGILWPVFQVDLGKGETYVLRSRPAAVVAERHAGDDNIVHLYDEVFLLALARLAVRDGGFLQVCTRRARLQQLRRRLVDCVSERKIVEGRPAGPGTASTNIRGICDTPGER